MTDLTNRLRAASDELWELCEEAADKIACLTAERDALKAKLDECQTLLSRAHCVVWAVANDGYCMHGVEGMTPPQQEVSDYTEKYPEGE